MPEIWLSWIAVLGGFIGLIWSADRFVAGSASIANNFGISKLIIGLTIVSMGTSAPEVVVAISASLKEAGDLAVGNALGSNLANIGLVLAITALVAPLPIQRHLIIQEVPTLLIITAIAGVVLFDAYISPVEGYALLGILIPLLWFMIYTKKDHPSPEEEDCDIITMSNLAAGFWFISGLTALIVSSELLVWGAQNIAISFGVSPLIIGLTVIAIGTSLPELAASITSALKGHQDMALGNIIGSNIFNILTVMSVPGIFHAAAMDSVVFSRDFMAMAGVTLLLCGAIFIDYTLRNRSSNSGSKNPALLGRRIGTLLLLSYIGYYYLLFQ